MSDRYGYIGIETLLNFCENTTDHAVTPNDFMRLPRITSGAVNKEAVIALLEHLAAEEKAMWDRTNDEQAFGAYTALESAVEKVEQKGGRVMEISLEQYNNMTARLHELEKLVYEQGRQRGRWLENETTYDDNTLRQTMTCSICGKRSRRPLGRYCRWCGADLEATDGE